MKLHLHKNATTTPAQRAFIQNTPHLSVARLAEKLGVSRTTVRRWRNRSSVYDRSHIPKRLSRALSPEEEVKVVLTRLVTRAGLDDLQRILAEFLTIGSSRAGLNRCLKRHHISKLPRLSPQVPFDLRDHTGTYLIYTCYHLPGPEGSTLYLHTLMDCSFRTLDARFCLSGHEFLYRQLREFPLRILGVIYQEPVILAPVSDPGAVRRHMATVEGHCRSFKTVAHCLPFQHEKTVDTLKASCLALARSGSGIDWCTPWPSGEALASAVNRYNTRFPLGALKQLTPRQALEDHYSHFPGSFRQKPETWAA